MKPQYPIGSHAECFYSLCEALRTQSNTLHSVDIQGNEHRSNKFIVGLECEKLLGQAFTGKNTESSLMTVRMKTNDENIANHFHILSTSEQL